MKTMPSLKDSILLLFHHMRLRFDGTKFPQLEATYQFIFTDVDNGFPVYMKFSRGTAEHSEGLSDNPSVTIRIPAALWLDISGGFRNPVWALITRQFTVEGQRSLFRLLPNLLTKKVDVPKSLVFSKEWTAPARVLVLIGNPRKKNGLTYFYLQALLDGMKHAGAAIEEIMLYEKKINYCLGCYHCWTKTPGRCVQKDDQAELLEKMNAADLIVYAMPMYYHSMPGLMKNHFDRQLPMMLPYVEKAGNITRHPRRNAVKHNIALFSVCGFPELEQFDPLVKTMEAYAKLGNVGLVTTVLIPGAMKLYYDPTHRAKLLEILQWLRSAGEQIIRKGAVDKKTLKAIGNIPTSLARWRDDSNWHWHDEINAGPDTAG